MSKDTKTLKAQIRAQVRQLRNQISSTQANLAGHQLSSILRSLTFYEAANRISCFLSFDGEIDTNPVIQVLQSDHKKCYLPKLRPTKPNHLWFLPWDKHTPMKPNQFGIPEVDLAINHACRISQLDILLMPLVAFDAHGGRLGMGGGFYDASLAHLKHPSWSGKRPLCIGIAFELQKVARVPMEIWDFKLDGVITEQQFYQFV